MPFQNAKVAVAVAAAALGVASIHACSVPKGPHDSEGRVAYPTPAPLSATIVTDSAKARETHALQTVWVIAMENHDWSDIAGSASAPYLNGTLLPMAAHAARYTSPRGVRPSEPNYIWLEAGDDLQITDNDDPTTNYRTTKHHLTGYLNAAGVTWRSYQESIPSGVCPLVSSGRYGAKHNPMLFFDDVTDGRQSSSQSCIEHVRPYPEMTADLAAGKVARYNFITPNMCSDMHDSDAGCETRDSVRNGDLWLSREVPKILASKEYQAGGVIFIVWDESEGSADAPIGLIAISKHAKPGYMGHVAYNHSSLLRTVQDVFAVKPYIRDAANASALDDLFVTYP